MTTQMYQKLDQEVMNEIHANTEFDEEDYTDETIGPVEAEESSANEPELQVQTEEQVAAPSSNLGKHTAQVEDIINKHFEYTKVKLTPDDPMVGLLLAQRIDLKHQLSEAYKNISKSLTVQNESIADRLIEVDKRFKTAQELSQQFEGQRQQLLMELGNIHQKNLVMYAKEQEQKLDELNKSTRTAIGLLASALAVSVVSLLVLIFKT